MTIVVDASLLVAAVTNRDGYGEWARDMLQSDLLAGCAHLPVEVAKVLRRMELARELTAEIATVAHSELTALNIQLYPYPPLATRIWQLRHTVTIQDAWYVALAESLGVPLVTVDLRLTRAPGPRCRFLTPPA